MKKQISFSMLQLFNLKPVSKNYSYKNPKKKKVWFSPERKAGNSEQVRAPSRTSRLFEIA